MQPVQTREEFIQRWRDTQMLTDSDVETIFEYVDALANKQNLSHALVITASRGCGKTTLQKDIYALAGNVSWKPLTELYLCDKNFNIHRTRVPYTLNQFTDVNAIVDENELSDTEMCICDMMADFMTNRKKQIVGGGEQNFNYRNLMVLIASKKNTPITFFLKNQMRTKFIEIKKKQ